MGARSQLRWVAIAAALGIAAMPAAAFADSPTGPDAAPSGSSGGPSPDAAPSAARKPAVVVKRTIPPARVAAPTVTQPTQTTAAPPPTATSTAAVKPARRATPQHHKKKPAHRKRKDPPPTKHSAAVLHVPSLPHLNPARLVVNSPNDDAARARKLAAGAVSLLLLALASGMLLAMAAKGERRRVAR
jgi:hypothetical protein